MNEFQFFFLLKTCGPNIIISKVYEGPAGELDYTCDGLTAGSVLGYSKSPRLGWIVLLFSADVNIGARLSRTNMIDIAISCRLVVSIAIQKPQRNVVASRVQTARLPTYLAVCGKKLHPVQRIRLCLLHNH